MMRILELRKVQVNRLQVRCAALEDRIDRLAAALEPFARHADAGSLCKALGHIEREHLLAARDALADRGQE